MKIIRAKNSGFCTGVQRAVATAQRCANKNYCILGELIHNQNVIDKLKQLGVDTVNSLDETLNYEGVIIRSHGEGKQAYDFFEKHQKTVVDATCPFVSKIHRIVKEHYAKGYQIVVVGDKNHPEVKAINGWCEQSALVFDECSQIEVLKTMQKICVVVQTTFSKQKYSLVLKNIEKLHLKTVEVFDTICYTTCARQQEALDLAQKCSKMLVIGCKNSSNTAKLTEICSEFCDTYLVSNVDELEGIVFDAADTVGIIAGASAPEELILEVFLYMSEKDEVRLDTKEEVVAAVEPKIEVVAEQSEPTVEQKPVEQAEPMAEQKAVEQAEPTAEQKPVEQAEPTAEQKPAEQAEPVVESQEQPDDKKKQQKSQKAKPTDDASLFREEMEKKPVNLRLGKKYKVEILSVDDKGIFVALGNNKRDGFIPVEEASLAEYNAADFKVGDTIYAVLKTMGDKTTGCHILSKRDIDLEKEADKVVDSIRDGSEFSLVVSEETKGGLVAKLASYRVFIPASQIRENFPRDLKQYVGKTLRLSVLEIDDEKHKIVASQRKVLEQERKQKEDKFWASIEEGQVVKGKVMRITGFGAFVDVNGFDCLAHIGDLSWVRIADVNEILKINETYDFLVLSANREKNKVSLGYKQLSKHPFAEVTEKYPVGTTVKGKVVRLVNFGAFVEIEKGVHALLHLSEASHNFIKNINEAVSLGDEIEAKITRIDPDTRKISLSVKALLPVPEVEPVVEEQEQKEEKPQRAAVDRASKKEFKRPNTTERKKPGKIDHKEDGPREWSEDNSNNPFADLLKDLNLK